MNQGDKYAKLFKHRPSPITSKKADFKKERMNDRKNNYNNKRNINKEPVTKKDESTSMRDKLERFKKEREMRKALVKKEVKPAFKAGVVQRHKSTWSPPPPPPTKTRRQPLRKINCNLNLNNKVTNTEKKVKNTVKKVTNIDKKVTNTVIKVTNTVQKVTNTKLNTNLKKKITKKEEPKFLLPQNHVFKPLEIFKNYEFTKSDIPSATIMSPFARPTKRGNKTKLKITTEKEKILEEPQHGLNESYTIETEEEKIPEEPEHVLNESYTIETEEEKLEVKPNDKLPDITEKESVLNESYTISDELNVTVEHDVCYFRELMNSEMTKMMTQVNKWSAEKDTWNLSNQLMEDAEADVLNAVGQAKLFCTNKLKQFENLINRCESGDTKGNGELAGRRVSCQDLEGFWGMISMQVRDIGRRFQELEESKARGWKKSEPVVQIKKKKSTKKQTKTKGSGLGEFIRKARLNTKKQKESTPKKLIDSAKKRVSLATAAASSPIIMRVSQLGKIALTPLNQQISERVKTPFARSILKTPGSQKTRRKRVDFPENNYTSESEQELRRSARLSAKKAAQEYRMSIEHRRSSLRKKLEL